MAVWRFLVLACALLAPGTPWASAQEPEATAAATATPSPIPIRAYNEKGQLTGSGWALPLDGAFITVRSLLANAARAELVFSDEMLANVSEVGGEDIEGNLVRIATDRSPAAATDSVNTSTQVPVPEFTSSAQPSQLLEESKFGSPDWKISCGATSYPLRDLRIRDIPVFGLAFTAETRHRIPISGCAVLNREGALEAIVVWEDPFGHPSAALVPAGRAARLKTAAQIPWSEWRAAQHPESRLRNSLLSEALSDIWREHYDLAQESLTYLLENCPTDAHGWYYRGYARAMSGKRALAVIDYENAVHFEPSNADARFSLGFSYALLRRIPDAREQLAALEALDQALAERLRTLVDSIVESGHGHAPAPEASSPAEPAPELPQR